MTSHITETIEDRRRALQAQIDTGRSMAERNRLGQFATPNVLAVEIATYVASLLGQSGKAVHFGDPAIGSGSFFSAALAVLGADRIRSAIGIEIDPAFCEAARRLWSDAGLKVVGGDFTRIVASGASPPAPNFILANPPYVRHHHLEREDKVRLRTSPTS